MTSPGKSLSAVPVCQIVLLHPAEKRRSVAFGPVKGKRWQPPGDCTLAGLQVTIASTSNNRDWCCRRCCG